MAVDGPPIDGFRQRPAWLGAVALLVVAQVGFGFQLFGGDFADSRPILDGRHPLHFYHAMLGAETLRETGGCTAYDPNFEAGYPKTPVFDAAARPLELILRFAAKPGEEAIVYKWPFFGICAIVPLAFVAAARGFAIPASGTIWAGLGGMVLWWTAPVQSLLKEGSFDLLGVGLAFIAFLGGMARYASNPGLTGWSLMAVASVAGWYFHPVAWMGLLPAVAVFYLVNAPKHGLAWHLGAIAVGGIGIAANLWWLPDWFGFWWVRRTSEAEVGSVGSGMFDWSRLSLGLAWPWVILAVIGLTLMVKRSRCGAAGGVIASIIAALTVVQLGEFWPPAAEVGTLHALALVPCLLLFPMAFAASEIARGMKIGPVFALLAAAVYTAFAWHPPSTKWIPGLAPEVTPLQIGFSNEAETWFRELKVRTNRDARILLEAGEGWNWTPLLPMETDRLFIGGLDSDSSLDHSACGLRRGTLAGRAFAEWTAADRAEYVRRYNIGWVLCRSNEAIEFWRADPTAKEVFRAGPNPTAGVLFELRRERSFILSGKAAIERQDGQKLVLRDVQPDSEGLIRLSFHYQKQLRASPHPLALIEAEPDLHDPIPFLNLRVPVGLSRVTLVWDRR